MPTADCALPLIPTRSLSGRIRHHTGRAGHARRGVTLVELMVVVVATAIIGIPMAVVFGNLVLVERRTMDAARAAADLEPLEAALREAIRGASADVGAGQDAFVISSSFGHAHNDLTVYVLTDPDSPATRTAMCRIWLDDASTVWIERYHPDAVAPWALSTNITGLTFAYGPRSAEAGGPTYGNFTLGTNPASILTTVTTAVGDSDFEHRILIYGPNVTD